MNTFVTQLYSHIATYAVLTDNKRRVASPPVGIFTTLKTGCHVVDSCSIMSRTYSANTPPPQKLTVIIFSLRTHPNEMGNFVMC
jgi:hypothetical protein